MKKAVYLLMIMLCMAAKPCTAQVMPDSMSNGRYLLYYYCDRIEIEEDYLNNAYNILRIKNILNYSTRIDSITIYAYASPEGSPSRNSWLAEKRAAAARDFILENLPEGSALKPENIFLRPMGENWEGLEDELEANYHLPNRDRVLGIIHADIPTETKKWRLKRLDNGYTYSLIIRNHMPKLRMATWICVHKPVVVPPRIDYAATEPVAIPPTVAGIDIPVPQSPEGRKTILALKSNLLYDLLTLLNYSIEVPVTDRFSALLYHQFPWYRWGEGNNKYCIRFLSVGAEARWWFKPVHVHGSKVRDRLSGHFLGIYAESGKWDFEWARDICSQGEHWSAGVSYGYSMPVGKRLNLEFSVSVGYASIPYRKYTPSEDYEILWRDPERQGRWNYIGPTKAQISLVVPITVKTKKKGDWQW